MGHQRMEHDAMSHASTARAQSEGQRAMQRAMVKEEPKDAEPDGAHAQTSSGLVGTVPEASTAFHSPPQESPLSESQATFSEQDTVYLLQQFNNSNYPDQNAVVEIADKLDRNKKQVEVRSR